MPKILQQIILDRKWPPPPFVNFPEIHPFLKRRASLRLTLPAKYQVGQKHYLGNNNVTLTTLTPLTKYCVEHERMLSNTGNPRNRRKTD